MNKVDIIGVAVVALVVFGLLSFEFSAESPSYRAAGTAQEESQNQSVTGGVGPTVIWDERLEMYGINYSEFVDLDTKCEEHEGEDLESDEDNYWTCTIPSYEHIGFFYVREW